MVHLASLDRATQPVARIETHLTRGYFWFAVFETISINLVGFTTLAFQDTLAELIHPGREPTLGEEHSYQFWVTRDPLAWNTQKEYILALMVAGWIALAGVLQACINFDKRVGVHAKYYTLMSFFMCDWMWMSLMYYDYNNVIHHNHIIGSVLTVLVRLTFVLRGKSSCFVEKIVVSDGKKDI